MVGRAVFIFLNMFFYLCKINRRGWVSAHCFISHTLTSIKLLFFSIYPISYEVYSSVDMKNTFSCCNINSFLADSLYVFFRKKCTISHSHDIYIQLDLIMNQFVYKLFSTTSSRYKRKTTVNVITCIQLGY